MRQGKTAWQQRAKIFHEQAEEYDRWFDNSMLFAIELAAISDLSVTPGRPGLEIGVGSGRFAEKLNIDFGIDPAPAPLLLARKRHIEVCRAIGENLPLADRSMAAIYLLFVLCFLAEPLRVLREVSRCLEIGGHLIMGMVPGDGPWGRELRRKKENNHPFYRYAEFYEVDEVCGWLTEAGFEILEIRSSLFQRPGQITSIEQSCPGVDKQAGFVVIAAQPHNPSPPGDNTMKQSS